MRLVVEALLVVASIFIVAPAFSQVVIVEAENYTSASRTIAKDTCSEGGQNITGLINGDWVAYNLTIPVTGDYHIEVRLASATGCGNVFVEADKLDLAGPIAVFNTGGGSPGPSPIRTMS